MYTQGNYYFDFFMQDKVPLFYAFEILWMENVFSVHIFVWNCSVNMY